MEVQITYVLRSSSEAFKVDIKHLWTVLLLLDKKLFGVIRLKRG